MVVGAIRSFCKLSVGPAENGVEKSVDISNNFFHGVFFELDRYIPDAFL